MGDCRPKTLNELVFEGPQDCLGGHLHLLCFLKDLHYIPPINLPSNFLYLIITLSGQILPIYCARHRMCMNERTGRYWDSLMRNASFFLYKVYYILIPSTAASHTQTHHSQCNRKSHTTFLISLNIKWLKKVKSQYCCAMGTSACIINVIAYFSLPAIDLL